MHQVVVRALPSFRSKIDRALWRMVWALLFRPSPTPLFWWRSFLLRMFGAEIGPGAHPYPTARVWAPWNLTMRAGSCLGAGVDCYNVDLVVLGQNAVVSQRAFLCSASHDHREPGFRLLSGPVEIGEGAWVAANAFIGPGVIVGNGAVVGACAVVVRDVPPGTVVAGNPARIVGGAHAPVAVQSKIARAGSE